MSELGNVGRRGFLRAALGVGGGAAAVGAMTVGSSIRDAYAQLLKSGIPEDSVLAKMKQEGKLRVGYAQTKPNFYRDLKQNKLRGIFHDVTEFLGKECEVEIDYQEVLWANATVGLRKGDFDLFVSSLTYTVPRALVVAYAGPIHHKGFLAICHKDNAGRFKSIDDFNQEGVVFSANIGSSQENQIKMAFPKAKIITVAGQLALAAEPVRAKQADLFIDGDFDQEVFAASNDWAHVVDAEHPFQRLPNTWACRYGDPAWKAFLDMFCDRMQSTGFMRERFAAYRQELVAGG
ncbi:MAG: transporter substrate-binding domain-containing protein [Ectothiorhodospiraceae bacterium]|nr:transporter substrate-binding domain-containing protein [Chromatiales bacterium]MCP5154059.1 transporter substrate-binding domain-containing protein [Ectothiorhodospiraceae bacterium]